jgi:hypothetical protein
LLFNAEAEIVSNDQLKKEIEKLTAGEEVFLKNGKELKKPEFKIVKLLTIDKEKNEADRELDWLLPSPGSICFISESPIVVGRPQSRLDETESGKHERVPGG